MSVDHRAADLYCTDLSNKCCAGTGASYRWPTYAIAKRAVWTSTFIFRFPTNLDKIMILIVMLRHTVFLYHLPYGKGKQNSNFDFRFFHIRDCAIIIRRGGGEKYELRKEKYYTIPPSQQRRISSDSPPNLPKIMTNPPLPPPPNHHPQIQWNPDFSNPWFNEPPDISN